jgi:hypothetical protein
MDTTGLNGHANGDEHTPSGCGSHLPKFTRVGLKVCEALLLRTLYLYYTKVCNLLLLLCYSVAQLVAAACAYDRFD